MDDKQIYFGEFKSWLDVAKQFSGNEYADDGDKKALAEIPEPEKVLYAEYDIEGYDGSALVVFRDDDGKYGWAEGSHCSYAGLEGQFKPTFYDTKALFKAVLDRKAEKSWGLEKCAIPLIQERIKRLK